MKYIIKNCENLHFGKYCSFSDTEYCKDCTDCLIKQIVELRNDVLEQETDPINTLEMSFAQKILQVLEIEEVNES